MMRGIGHSFPVKKATTKNKSDLRFLLSFFLFLGSSSESTQIKNGMEICMKQAMIAYSSLVFSCPHLTCLFHGGEGGKKSRDWIPTTPIFALLFLALATISLVPTNQVSSSMGHFRVAVCLGFEASLGAHLL